MTETFHPVVGGGETQAQLLASGFAARDIATLVLTRRSARELARSERLGRFVVERRGPPGRGQSKKWLFAVASLPALLRHCRRDDVLLVSGFRIAGAVAVLAGRMRGCKVVLKADSAGEMSGEFFAPGLARYGMRPGHGLFRIFLGARNTMLRGADAFVAITDDVAAEFTQAGIDNSRVHRIPNAVDTDRFRPASPGERIAARQRLGLPPDAQVAIYTGRLVTYKGLPALLEAWTRLQPAHPDAHLVLLGEGGLDMHACEAELKEVVHARGLATRILFPGSVRNVEEYLRAADLFVFPTENDAFPSSLIEAMQTGLPVITTPVGAIREIVRHEDNGLLIAPGDHVRLEQSLRRLLSDRELARSLGRSAWTSVAARFGADRVTEKYLALFDTFRDRA